MNTIINELEAIQTKKNINNFNVGDVICVNFTIIDKKYKNRKQNFEGIVIAKHNNNLSSTFKVRKISYGEGVEKTFPLHSPIINSIEIKKRGFVKKAKIYYIRNLTGKAARIKEKKTTTKRRNARVV